MPWPQDVSQKGAWSPAGLSTKGLIELRSEAKAPFRLTRIIITGGIAGAAVISLIVTLTRLPAALKGERSASLICCVRCEI